MKPSNSELKSVTNSTTFDAVRVLDQGMERNALIDQDGHIVGLVDSQVPYFIAESFSEACKKAERGLRSGACYKGYPCTSFGQHHYVIDTTLEPITDLSDIPEVREMEELANEAISLARKLRARRNSDKIALPNEKIISK